MRIHWGRILLASPLLLLAAAAGFTQQPASAAQPQEPGAPSAEVRQRPDDGGQPLFGKITAIENGKLELAKPDGATVAVKINDKTEFRKDRQSAKLGDFKVGDMVFVRAEEGADHSVTALMVGGRTGSRPGGLGMGIRGGAGGGMMGELGKDFVAGEVKSVNAPQLTVLRPDNVTQTLELNEETSLRKGRESVTLADIQLGDHVFVRGAMQNDVFVPKSVMVIGPEQWKRMQDMGMAPGGNKPAADPASKPPQQ